ncbi:hypothetical protein H0H92_011385 [Tricholoma furcatifolium]|nr:hypothetical protein H0H92_011385 [Tricholoma furcatifolium]
MPYPHTSHNNHLNITPDNVRKSYDHSNSPVTPAVTGIVYPSTPLDSITEADTSVYHAPPNRLYTHPNVAGSNIDDGSPRPLSDGHSLDKLWSTIRQQKSRQMAKEKPKVQSLEEVVHDLSLSDQHVDIPVMESQESDPKSLKKRKSISSFRESSDGRMTVATFDLHNVAKQDIHVSYQRNRLIVTWATAEINEWEDKGVVYRERLERHYHRTLPLAEGTKVIRFRIHRSSDVNVLQFEDIRGIMNERTLTLRYPLARCLRVEPRSRSGDS